MGTERGQRYAYFLFVKLMMEEYIYSGYYTRISYPDNVG